MDLRTEITYPGASIDDVLDMMLDVDFRVAVCDATAAVDHEVEVQPFDDGSTTVTVSRTIPAEVPDFLRRFVGETITLVQNETWAADDGSGSRRADLSLQVIGQPATMTGSLRLESMPGGGVLESVQGDLKVMIPLLGKKIEAEIVKGVLAAAKKEQEIGREWLSA